MNVLIRYTCGGAPVPVHSHVVVADNEVAAALEFSRTHPGCLVTNAVADVVVRCGVGRYLPGRIEAKGAVHYFRVWPDGSIKNEPTCSTYLRKKVGFIPALAAVNCPGCLHLMEWNEGRERQYQAEHPKAERGSAGAWLLVLLALAVAVLLLVGAFAPVEVSSCTPDAALPVLNAPFIGLEVDYLVPHQSVLYTQDFLGWRKVVTRKLVEGWVIKEFCRE